MKKALSLLLCCIFVFSCLFGFSGCFLFLDPENPYPYNGEYKELYTAAIYSIPDAVGYMSHGEGAFDSEIYVWEQDSYGRTIFSYCEDSGNRSFGLVVCQAYDETNVYFYPEINYDITDVGASSWDTLKNKTEAFYLEKREELKVKNDGGKPIDKSKCVFYPITDHKILGEDVRSLSTVECNRILNDYSNTLDLPNPYRYPHRNNYVLQVDADGKILHSIYGVHQHYDNPNWKNTDEYTSYSITLWVITDKDGNYDKENGVMVIYSAPNTSNNTYGYKAEDVLAFKERNNWKWK